MEERQDPRNLICNSGSSPLRAASVSLAAVTITSDLHHNPALALASGVYSERPRERPARTGPVRKRRRHPAASLPPLPTTPWVWRRQETHWVAPRPFPCPQTLGRSLLVLGTESRPQIARPSSSIWSQISSTQLWWRSKSPFCDGDNSVRKGRAVFRVSLRLRSELLSLGGPQESTRNSLIPGRLPPSGGRFSAKRDAPGSKHQGGRCSASGLQHASWARRAEGWDWPQ